MKVLIISGSPRTNGNTQIAINELTKEFEKENIEVKNISIGTKDIRGCIACGTCYKTGKCVFNDLVNEGIELLKEVDGVIIASPVYYASANGSIISFLDRMFYANHTDLTMKVGASVAVARRGGTSSTFDELNKYFTISGMPVASSYYWNSVHGRDKGEAQEDKEGLYTMRMLAKNMIFLMKAIALGKEKYGLPVKEERAVTNFIH